MEEIILHYKKPLVSSPLFVGIQIEIFIHEEIPVRRRVGNETADDWRDICRGKGYLWEAKNLNISWNKDWVFKNPIICI